VLAKLKDGNITAAIRIVCSEESPTVPSIESLRNLQTRHPPGSLDSSSLPVPNQTDHLAVTESDVKKAVHSFPSGSARGPDGLRPQHLKDHFLCPESGSDFLSALTLRYSSVSVVSVSTNRWRHTANSYRFFFTSPSFEMRQQLRNRSYGSCPRPTPTKSGRGWWLRRRNTCSSVLFSVNARRPQAGLFKCFQLLSSTGHASSSPAKFTQYLRLLLCSLCSPHAAFSWSVFGHVQGPLNHFSPVLLPV